MNHPGEIAPLAAIAAPDVAIITNIGIAHIEFMGTREAIAQEKGHARRGARRRAARVILSARRRILHIASRRAPRPTRSSPASTRGDVRATRSAPALRRARSSALHADGRTRRGASCPCPASTWCATRCSPSPRAASSDSRWKNAPPGLRKLQLTKGRLEQKIVRGIQILDDTYNANPDSMAAALRTLAQTARGGPPHRGARAHGRTRRRSERGHRSVGEAAARERIDCVIGVGAEAALDHRSGRSAAASSRCCKCDSTEEATQRSARDRAGRRCRAVKGSRSARMERIVEGLADAMMYYLHQLSERATGPISQGVQRLPIHHLPRASRAAITAFLLSLMCGNWVIRRLISLKLGQPIRTKEEVHKLSELHGGKAGHADHGRRAAARRGARLLAALGAAGQHRGLAAALHARSTAARSAFGTTTSRSPRKTPRA